jgi:very-short-patch-repair endonuclease
MLRGRRAGGFRFRREHVFAPYILDFYCGEVRVAVEVDGAAHDTPEQREHDARRDAFLRGKGVTVLRARAEALMYEPEAVVAWIVERCRAAASGSSSADRESGGR